MRRALKISAWVTGSVLLLVALLSATLFVAGNCDSGRALIEHLTYRLSSTHVKLSGLGGSFPAQLTLNRLQLSDDRGVWLTADRVSLHWAPLKLLGRQVQVDSLKVARLFIERAPVAEQQSGSTSIPHIDIARLSIDVLELGPALAGTAASVSVTGSVQLRSLQDAMADVVARRIGGDGEYALHFRFDPKRMDGTLTLHEPAGGPLENVLQLPGLGALSAAMTLSGPRHAERIDLKVDAGGLQARAQGTIDLDKRSADLDYSAAATAMRPRPDLAWQRLDLRGRWHGNISTPVADGHLEIDKLSLAGGTALAALKATLAANAGLLTVSAVVDGLAIPGPNPRLLQRGPLKIDAAMHLNDPTRPIQLVAAHRLFSLRAQAVTAGQQSASLDLRLIDLTPFAALGGQDVSGSAAIKAQFTRSPTEIRLALNADANIAGGTASWIDVVGNRAALQAAAVLSDASVTIERLQLTGRKLTLSASGRASRPAPGASTANSGATRGIGDLISDMRARWELKVADLGTLSSVLAGRMDASGSLYGRPTALASDAQLTATLSVGGSPSGGISGTLHARGLPGAPNGTLQLHGTADGAPMTVDIAIESGAGASFRALIREADWKSARIDGDVSIGADMAITRGQLHLKLGQLGDLDPFLGLSVRGRVEGQADFNPAAGHTHTQFHLDAHDLSVGPFAGNAQLSGEGTWNALNLQLTAQMPNLHGFPASLSSAALLNFASSRIEVASAALQYRGQELRLLAPAEISFADTVLIKPLALGAQAAVFQIGGRVAPTLDLRASLRHLNPALINAFFPDLLAEGTIEGTARLQGSVAAPTGRIRLDANGIRMADEAATGLPVLDLRATAQLTGDKAIIDGHLIAGTASLLTVSGSAPLNDSGVLDLKMTGKLDIGLINPLLEARGQHAAGELSIDATLAGTTSAPQIGGTIHLAKGSFRDYGRGANLSNITADVVGSEGTLQIKSFTAAASSGSVTMTGTIGVLQPGLPVDLKLIAKNAQPIQSNIVTANLDANLHVSGKARERIDVAGTVHLNRTNIGIPNTLPPNVAVLEVRRRGQKAPPPAAKQLVIGLDVEIHAPQQMLVEGRGLNAELAGDLHLGGTTDTPLVSGSFDLQRGSFTIAGNKLSFTDGHVSFDGAGLDHKIDPTLDFTATANVTDATVTLHITGHADSPKFDFSSDSGLDQDDIMARLLFGVPGAQLTALQVAQIGAALAVLSGVGGDSALNPLVKLQKSLGLDRLTVGANTVATPTGATNSGATIEAGRYVSKRVYVEAKQSSTGSSQVQVDVDLTKHLKLQTRLGNGTAITQGTTPENDPGSSIGLSYQFEY
jgi:translocation and assembly module TamB